jgi:Phage holin T7 family, holin superfamily II
MKTDLIAAAPPVGVTTLSLFGVPLAQWVLVLTAVYTVLLIVKTLPGAVVAVRRGYRWLKERYEQSHRE